MSVRFGQILLALCLTTSLLMASSPACCCPPPQGPDAASETHKETGKIAKASTDANVFADEYTCAIQQSPLYLTAKSPTKELRSTDSVAKLEPLIANVEFSAVTAHQESTVQSRNDLSYSSTLKSLLPPRAPPRL